VGGLGLVLITYQLGQTFYDRRTGFISGLVLATSGRLLWESRFLRLDTVLAFFLFLGFYYFLKAFTKKASANNYLLAYLCFALATLTKGPVGLVLPGLAVLSFILLTGRWRDIREIRLVSGFITAALVLAPWLLMLHLKGKDQWVSDFIWTHNIQNYALESIGHVRPFYYYFINLPPDFLPWVLLVPGALLFCYPWKDKLRNPATLALVCWFATVFVFFSLSKSKIAYYLLPPFAFVSAFGGLLFEGTDCRPRSSGGALALDVGISVSFDMRTWTYGSCAPSCCLQTRKRTSPLGASVWSGISRRIHRDVRVSQRTAA
jgi:4-amino-4-deoxy-L-arabinose transferase-like glycosyltransferase